MKNVLVIGGSGYIGTEIVTEFLKLNIFIHNIDNKIYPDQEKLQFISNQKIQNYYLDFRNEEKVSEILDKVDNVIILAGLVGDYITKKYQDISKSINDNGIKNLIDLIGSKKNIKKLIFVSTCSNYGLSNSHKLLDENSTLNPISHYAKAKVDIEKYIISKKESFNFNYTILRFATAFGLSRRMRYDLTVNHFCYSMFFLQEVEIYDAETWRPYCHVKDFSRIILKILDEKNTDKVKNQIFNVGSEENNHTKSSIAKLINNYLPNSKIIESKKEDTDKRNYKVSFKKINETLNIDKFISVEFGIRQILENFENNRDFINVDELKKKGNFEILSHVKK